MEITYKQLTPEQAFNLYADWMVERMADMRWDGEWVYRHDPTKIAF